MSKHILYCSNCNKYTLKEACPSCDNKLLNPKPAKYSPEDKYGKYRRVAKKEQKDL
ncbi:MAG: RNA-protein complex protein Nop10 [Nanoarchaeota archaeon]|nr:RNA-protein complex protein Nop10 [Nanoarchaeota archaeon]